MTEIETPRRRSLHGHWSSRLAFILAVSGSAVGLGNIWRFPYVAGVNGGGAFVLVYLLCVFAIGLPIMMAEILIGRRGRRNPAATMALRENSVSVSTGSRDQPTHPAAGAADARNQISPSNKRTFLSFIRTHLFHSLRIRPLPRDVSPFTAQPAIHRRPAGH